MKLCNDFVALKTMQSAITDLGQFFQSEFKQRPACGDRAVFCRTALARRLKK
jgi:hypothetical protein